MEQEQESLALQWKTMEENIEETFFVTNASRSLENLELYIELYNSWTVHKMSPSMSYTCNFDLVGSLPLKKILVAMATKSNPGSKWEC